MSVALAVEVGIEVGDGVAATVAAKVGVGSEAMVGTDVAAAVVTGTAMGADVAGAPQATTNRMTTTASPGVSRPLHICVIEKSTHKLPLIDSKQSSGDLSFVLKTSNVSFNQKAHRYRSRPGAMIYLASLSFRFRA